MTAQEIRTSKEKGLFWVAAVISLVAWLALVVTIIGILYGLLVGFFLFVAHSLMIAYIKGHGVRLSKQQFPELYDRVVVAAGKLGLNKTPEVYLMQAGGALNAFATKWTGRNFVVIYSDLLEACGEDGKEIDMIIGHEIGHLALGHLKWLWFLVPAKIVPLLGTAYSRACEYSCDLCGFEVTNDLDAAARGLAILSAGGKYGKQVDLQVFVEQVWDTGGFWASIYELNATHPYLSKRVAALINKQKPEYKKAVRRNVLAYPLAPFLGIAAPGSSAPLVMFAMIGIMAAVAIPQFEAYRHKANAAVMDKALTQVCSEARVYYKDNGRWPRSAAECTTPSVYALMAKNKWKLKTDPEGKYAAITFNQGKEEHYRSISFDSGEISEGVMK